MTDFRLPAVDAFLRENSTKPHAIKLFQSALYAFTAIRIPHFSDDEDIGYMKLNILMICHLLADERAVRRNRVYVDDVAEEDEEE